MVNICLIPSGVIKHGWLEAMDQHKSSVIFLATTLLLIEDFPASHVWWHRRVTKREASLFSHMFWRFGTVFQQVVRWLRITECHSPSVTLAQKKPKRNKLQRLIDSSFTLINDDHRLSIWLSIDYPIHILFQICGIDPLRLSVCLAQIQFMDLTTEIKGRPDVRSTIFLRRECSMPFLRRIFWKRRSTFSIYHGYSWILIDIHGYWLIWI